MENQFLKGGEFLVRDVDHTKVFVPEEFNEEQRMIGETSQDFLDKEVFTVLDRIDNQEEGLMRDLLGKAGELGLLGVSLPEEYDGFGQTFTTAMLANEKIGSAYSFSVAYSAHIGIGTCPLAYYGNDEQKQRYLPKLATGKWIAAYCLTEPNAGSDANAGKTNVRLSEDGKHYILNGQKMWITNGGFADVLTVFAKIDNDRVLSAFIVEANSEGISTNPEEKKMGIKGSSTRLIFFEDVKVPVENLLGKRGEGFRIALNILHMGRIKLGGIALGAEKLAITQSVQYANERKQFGSPISSFGAIKYKLSEQVIRTFTNESAVYRTCKNIDAQKNVNLESGMSDGQAEISSIATYAIEAALLKVYGSEVLDYVIDEAVQIFGGMGYASESVVERGYRDSRINRIFEGTNEINRILITDTTLKKAMKKDIAALEKAEEILSNLSAHTTLPVPGDYFGEKLFNISQFKKAILMIIGQAYKILKNDLVKEQEIMMNIADMIMQLFAAESTLLRVKRLSDIKGADQIDIYKDILNVFLYDSACKIRKQGMDAINSFVEGEEWQTLMDSLMVFTTVNPVNIKIARRRVADRLIEDNKYNF